MCVWVCVAPQRSLTALCGFIFSYKIDSSLFLACSVSLCCLLGLILPPLSLSLSLSLSADNYLRPRYLAEQQRQSCENGHKSLEQPVPRLRWKPCVHTPVLWLPGEGNAYTIYTVPITFFILVDIDNYHDKCQIIISFKFKVWFLFLSSCYQFWQLNWIVFITISRYMISSQYGSTERR